MGWTGLWGRGHRSLLTKAPTVTWLVLGAPETHTHKKKKKTSGQHFKRDLDRLLRAEDGAYWSLLIPFHSHQLIISTETTKNRVIVLFWTETVKFSVKSHVNYEASYLKPVMTPVAWVAGIWLTALDLHLSHREVKTEHDCKRLQQTSYWAWLRTIYRQSSQHLGRSEHIDKKR